MATSKRLKRTKEPASLIDRLDDERLKELLRQPVGSPLNLSREDALKSSKPESAADPIFHQAKSTCAALVGSGAHSSHVSDLALDTSFFIDMRRGHEGALAMWAGVQSGDITASYSPLTVYELWVGQRIDRIEEAFYESLVVYLEEAPLTSSGAKTAGLWLRQLSEKATEALVRDALIAATAGERDETVCKLNRRDFLRLPVPVREY